MDELRGRRFELVVCAGARAEKWKANREPAADLSGIERLLSALREVRADRFVLVSTVDVYERPLGVDESVPADAAHPYGRHRRLLEELCAERFDAQIARLPALFGPGLKKNAIYDLLHDNQVEKIHPDSAYQFYDVRRLWEDLEMAHRAGLRLLHFATEPVAMREIAARCFGRELAVPAGPPASYDFRTLHASALAAEALAKLEPGESVAARKRQVAGVTRAVAEFLRNTPANAARRR